MAAVGNALAAIDPGPALKSVGNAAGSIVKDIGKGAESLGREIGKVGEAALQNPVGTIAKIGAVATGQVWALPIISAVDVVAHGGSIEDALKAGAISYAASVVAAGISDSLNSAFASELTSSVGDASLVSTNTLADGTIQHVFSDGSTILQGVNGALSTTPATIAPSLAAQLPVSVLQSINTALANAGGSAAMTALQGGNLSEVLLDAASGGVGSFAGTQTTQQLQDLGLNAKVAQVLGRTTGAAAAGAVEGQDASQIFNTALVNNIVRTSLSEAGTALKNTEVAKGLTKYLNEAIQPFKDSVNEVKQSFLDQAKKLTDLKTEADTKVQDLISQSSSIKSEAETYYNDVLKAAEGPAQSAFETASESFNQYKSVADEFSGLVAKYEEAKAANNIELANQYADQANALIPKLNEVTDRYNTDYTAYETAKTDFETKNQTYLGYVNKLNQLNDEYTQTIKSVDDQLNVVNKTAEQFNGSVEEMQSTLNARAQEVKDAYTKASEYSPIAKSAFAELFGETGDLTRATNLSEQVNALPQDNQRMYDFAKSFGMRPEDAIEFAPDISKMSIVAKQSFFDSLAQNPDANVAFETANRINSLDKAQQDSFFNARMQGLDNEQAFDVASTMAGASKEQQDVYIDVLRSGLGGTLGSIFAAAQGLAGPGTRYESEIDKNLAALKTQEAKDAYQFYLSALGPENVGQAFALAQGQDQAVLAGGTGTQSAGMGGAYLPPSEKSFFDARRFNPATQEWEPIPIQEPETGGMGGGAGTGTATGISESGLRLTQRDIDQYRAEGVPEAELQKLVDQYGIYTPGTDIPDEYQILIDRLFEDPKIKARKAGTGSGAGAATTTGTGIGATTGTGTGVAPVAGTGTAPTTGVATGTSGLTQTGTATTGGAGGTEAVPGGAGGTAQTGAGTGTTAGGGGTGGFGIGGIGGGGFALPGGFGMFGLAGQDTTGGIKNLTAGLTERMDYNLAGLPSDQDVVNPLFNAPQVIQPMAAGGSTTTTYDPFSTKDTSGGSSINSSLAPNLTKAQINYILTGLPDYLRGHAEGGHIEGHNPQFYSEGGLSAIENRFVKGDGDGTSDSIPAMLANGEFVIPADVVSSLGNGSNDAGAGVLDEFLKVIRDHKRKADSKKLPPDSKGPLAYLIDAQRRTKA